MEIVETQNPKLLKKIIYIITKKITKFDHQIFRRN